MEVSKPPLVSIQMGCSGLAQGRCAVPGRRSVEEAHFGALGLCTGSARRRTADTRTDQGVQLRHVHAEPHQVAARQRHDDAHPDEPDTSAASHAQQRDALLVRALGRAVPSTGTDAHAHDQHPHCRPARHGRHGGAPCGGPWWPSRSRDRTRPCGAPCTICLLYTSPSPRDRG